MTTHRDPELNPRQRQLLEDLVMEHEPTLKPTIYNLYNSTIDANEFHRLEDVVTRVFMEHGLKDDDEPNAFGRQLDELIGALSQLSPDFNDA
jgi:hypothetical protein